MPRAKSPKNGHAKPADAVAAPVVNEVKIVAASGDLETEIRRRAFELYMERGCTPGHESEDWLVAEREVLARNGHTNV